MFTTASLGKHNQKQPHFRLTARNSRLVKGGKGKHMLLHFDLKPSVRGAAALPAPLSSCFGGPLFGCPLPRQTLVTLVWKRE